MGVGEEVSSDARLQGSRTLVDAMLSISNWIPLSSSLSHRRCDWGWSVTWTGRWWYVGVGNEGEGTTSGEGGSLAWLAGCQKGEGSLYTLELPQ